MGHGCDISERSAQRGSTALMIAAEKGYKDVVSLLLKNGADVNAAGEFGPSTLHAGRDSLLKRPRTRICSSGPTHATFLNDRRCKVTPR